MIYFPQGYFISYGNQVINPFLSVSPSVEFDSPKEKKGIETFRVSIQMLVKAAEEKKITNFAITALTKQFSFQRRRLYDVINVLEAIGVCKKTSVDMISWYGLSCIPNTIKLLQKEKNLDSSPRNLEILFPDDTCISISNLTKAYILCFSTLQSQTLNLKSVANLFSKQNGRFKTTLCKLYQITHVLEAAGIVQKTVVPGEVTICDPYYILNSPKEKELNMLSIDALLNHHIKSSNINDQKKSNIFSEVPAYVPLDGAVLF